MKMISGLHNLFTSRKAWLGWISFILSIIALIITVANFYFIHHVVEDEGCETRQFSSNLKDFNFTLNKRRAISKIHMNDKGIIVTIPRANVQNITVQTKVCPSISTH